MIARDIMTKHTYAVGPEATILALIEQMFGHEIRHIPVVEGDHLLGIVSERDVRELLYPLTWNAARAEEHATVLRKPVGHIMQRELVSVDTETSVHHIIDLMLDERIGAVPVVDARDNTLVGIVSYVDVLRALRYAA